MFVTVAARQQMVTRLSFEYECQAWTRRQGRNYLSSGCRHFDLEKGKWYYGSKKSAMDDHEN